MKVALIHDWLTGMRGGEKCLEVFCELFPEATVHTLLHKKGSVSGTIENMEIKTSFLQKIPGIERNYRNFLPFFPMAIESFDMSGYDLILSSSHCVAKGIKKKEGSLHLCYCHTPVRYAWKFFDDYFSGEAALKRWAILRVIKGIKNWDIKANRRVDYFISISDNIRSRIKEYYGRESDIIFPPVETNGCEASASDNGYYLIVSALVPYKRVDLAVKAFNENGKRLVIVGSGDELERLKASASGNVEFKDWVSDQELKDYFSNCRALIFPGDEDFGIVPVEAQAYGKAVIAFAAGGALETVVPLNQISGGEYNVPPTGVFFTEQTVESLNEALGVFEEHRGRFIPEKIRENAVKFNRERYKAEISDYVNKRWEEHANKK